MKFRIYMSAVLFRNQKHFSGRTAIVLGLLFTSSLGISQDTIQTRAKPKRPNEIGISFLTPVIMLSGATETRDRFSNLTFRHRITEKHSARVLVGAAPDLVAPDELNHVSSSPTATIYTQNHRSMPSNFQIGLGYELMWGRRLKPCLGIDLIYNNQFEKQIEHTYKDSLIQLQGLGNRIVSREFVSSRTTGAVNRNKLGANFNFSLRYEVSRRWCLTATTIMSLRFWQENPGPLGSRMSELNMIGLLGDISLFYKF